MITLNRATSADNYTAANTLEASEVFAQINLDISNASIYYQVKQPQAGAGGKLRADAWQWSQEVYATVSFQSLGRRCGGVRFRSAQSGAPAEVTATLLNSYDIGA